MERFIVKTPRDLPVTDKHPAPPPGLPDPNNEDSTQAALECVTVNDAIEATAPKTRKRGSYGIVDEEERLKSARYAIEFGPAKASRHFSAKLGRPMNESTVRSIRKKYQKTVLQSAGPAAVMTSLAREKRGPEPYIGKDLDDGVQQRLRRIGDAGGIINRTIVYS